MDRFLNFYEPTWATPNTGGIPFSYMIVEEACLLVVLHNIDIHLIPLDLLTLFDQRIKTVLTSDFSF